LKQINVKLWGSRVCAIAIDDTGELITEFDPTFVKGSLDISPILLPLEDLKKNPTKIHSFTNYPEKTYHGLPPFLVDSLPDDFGNSLVNKYMSSIGKLPKDITVIDRLAYTGKRAMGSFEFEPPFNKDLEKNEFSLEMSGLVEAARKALRGDLNTSSKKSLQDLLTVGTSAGGARAKAVITWNPKTDEIRGGQFDAPVGSEHWILKFDGVGKDSELGTTENYGRIEYAYYLMAKDAGIEISESRLLEENGRAHFMTKRFDRDGNKKIYYQSLCGLMGMDYKQRGVHDYEQYFRCIQALNLGHLALEEGFRRMAFNIMGRNCDDHTKNFGFLLNPSGEWSLAPAFDLIYAHNPEGEWTYQHLIGIHGKYDHFKREDLLGLAEKFSIKNARYILDQVKDVVFSWKTYAKEALVKEEIQDMIQKNLNLI
jgi:serine/threonine-protein kinase HipA